jgi:phage protein D
MKTPLFRLEASSNDITMRIQKNLISLRIVDKSGLTSDSFELTLADPDGAITWPEADIELKVWLGYKEEGLVYKGAYVVDEIKLSGPPDQFTIIARAVDLNDVFLKTQRSQSWHDCTLGSILIEIAQKNKLSYAIGESFMDKKIDHIDQTTESDMSFMTRLAQTHGAIAKVAGGSLVFTKYGLTKTTSGDDMPRFTLRLAECASYNFTYCAKHAFDGVAAQYHTDGAGPLNFASSGTPNSGSIKTIKKVFASESEAQSAADAELNRLNRKALSGDISMMGKPELCAESELTLVGWRSDIEKVWVISEVTHELSKGSGLSSHVQLERKLL